MKKVYCNPLGYPFLFLLLAITSCHQPSNTNALENTKLELAGFPKTGAQISEYVVAVFEDKAGHLWFGTMTDGAVRYDGKTLTYFSVKDGLCDHTVASIAQDQAGNLWFGTHAGASKYDGKTFTNYAETNGLYGSGCNLLVDRQGNLWAGTNHGVFRYNGFSFVEFKLPNPVIESRSYKVQAGKVWSLLEDRKGNLWFGRDGFGACKFDGTTFTHFTQRDGLCSNNVASIVEDKQGHIWFGCITSDFPKSKAGGLSRYDGHGFTQYPDLKGLTENDIYTIYADRKGHIWIGASGVGAYRYDGEKFTLFTETDRQDLTTNFGLQSMLEDSQGTLWFGFSGGLFRFNGTALVNVTRHGPWK